MKAATAAGSAGSGHARRTTLGRSRNPPDLDIDTIKLTARNFR
jgi:hypothetical protein